MASFIAKQLVGKQLDSVKGALGDKEGASNEEKKEVDPEVEAALREAEERRLEKHRKMEEERETIRQGIRDKYGLKKKEEACTMDDFGGSDGNRLGRKRKTAAELAADAKAAEEEEDSILGFLPPNVREMANKVTDAPKQLVSEATEKCDIM